jgi:hypothetical protein
MTDLPDWFEPLLTRVQTTQASDFTRLPTPDGEGRRQSAVLVLLSAPPPCATTPVSPRSRAAP